MTKKHQFKDSEFTLSMPDLRKIINAAESLRDRCILKLFAYTGLRRAELAALDVRDVELKENRV